MMRTITKDSLLLCLTLSLWVAPGNILAEEATSSAKVEPPVAASAPKNATTAESGLEQKTEPAPLPAKVELFPPLASDATPVKENQPPVSQQTNPVPSASPMRAEAHTLSPEANQTKVDAQPPAPSGVDADGSGLKEIKIQEKDLSVETLHAKDGPGITPEMVEKVLATGATAWGLSLAQEAIKKGGHPITAQRLRILAAQAYATLDRNEDALSLLEGYTGEQGEYDSHALLLLGDIDWEIQEYDKAAKNYVAFITRYPQDPRRFLAELGLAHSVLRMDKIHEAELALDVLTEDNPQSMHHPRFRLVMAELREQQGVLPAAYEGWQQVMAMGLLRPEAQEAAWRYARRLRVDHKPDEAEKGYLQLLQLPQLRNSKKQAIAMELATIWAEQKNWPQAIGILEWMMRQQQNKKLIPEVTTLYRNWKNESGFKMESCYFQEQGGEILQRSLDLKNWQEELDPEKKDALLEQLLRQEVRLGGQLLDGSGLLSPTGLGLSKLSPRQAFLYASAYARLGRTNDALDMRNMIKELDEETSMVNMLILAQTDNRKEWEAILAKLVNLARPWSPKWQQTVVDALLLDEDHAILRHMDELEQTVATLKITGDKVASALLYRKFLRATKMGRWEEAMPTLLALSYGGTENGSAQEHIALPRDPKKYFIEILRRLGREEEWRSLQNRMAPNLGLWSHCFTRINEASLDSQNARIVK